MLSTYLKCTTTKHKRSPFLFNTLKTYYEPKATPKLPTMLKTAAIIIIFLLGCAAIQLIDFEK